MLQEEEECYERELAQPSNWSLMQSRHIDCQDQLRPSDLVQRQVQSNPAEPLFESFPQEDLTGVFAEEFDNESLNSEDEGIEDYVKGGYHPVFRGEVLNGRYVILQKLGWGHFSTVWLSRDVKFNTYVAIKIQKSETRYLEAAFDEVEILQKAVKQTHNPNWLKDLDEIFQGTRKDFGADDCHVVQLLNAFIYQGPFGRHFCMVFEILGVNLLEIIKRYDYKGIPLNICKEICKQVLIGLHYLHTYCGIIHTDLKPENVMVCLNVDELKEIVESGQLNNDEKIRKRLGDIKLKIRILRGEKSPKVEESVQLEEVFNEAVELTEKTKENMSEGEQITVNGKPLLPKGLIIKNDEDLNREFELICSMKNLTNKNEKKNLKKKLKKKLKVFQKESVKKFKGSMRQNMNFDRVEEKSHPEKPKLNLDPNFLKSGLTDQFRIKIADLGNGCWTHHHFQPEIQTRQYRSPETILGVNYNETADIWSLACMLFEMLTGEFLFDPRKNQLYSKSTDHLRLMMEMLNKFPKAFSTVGTLSKQFLDPVGNFKQVSEMSLKSMKGVLVGKYRVKVQQAVLLEEFLRPMLEIFPEKRIGAFESLRHEWIKIIDKDQFCEELEEFNEENLEEQCVNLDRAVEEEDFDADKSGISDSNEELEVQEELRSTHLAFEKEIKFFDRNFKSVYVGFADGIDLNHLDNTMNWQF